MLVQIELMVEKVSLVLIYKEYLYVNRFCFAIYAIASCNVNH